MAKKGATQSGGTKGRLREKNASMVKYLPPAPQSHRHKPETFPYHNNLGTDHGKNKKDK